MVHIVFKTARASRLFREVVPPVLSLGCMILSLLVSFFQMKLTHCPLGDLATIFKVFPLRDQLPGPIYLSNISGWGQVYGNHDGRERYILRRNINPA